MMAAGVVAAGIWIALMHPYLEFEFRIAGSCHMKEGTGMDR